MSGSNDLERSSASYDATFIARGGAPGKIDDRGRLVYIHNGSRLMVTTPIDGKPATAADGGTIGLVSSTADQVLAWYDAGATNGERQLRVLPPRVRTAFSWSTFVIPMEIN